MQKEEVVTLEITYRDRDLDASSQKRALGCADWIRSHGLGRITYPTTSSEPIRCSPAGIYCTLDITVSTGKTDWKKRFLDQVKKMTEDLDYVKRIEESTIAGTWHQVGQELERESQREREKEKEKEREKRREREREAEKKRQKEKEKEKRLEREREKEREKKKREKEKEKEKEKEREKEREKAKDTRTQLDPIVRDVLRQMWQEEFKGEVADDIGKLKEWASEKIRMVEERIDKEAQQKKEEISVFKAEIFGMIEALSNANTKENEERRKRKEGRRKEKGKRRERHSTRKRKESRKKKGKEGEKRATRRTRKRRTPDTEEKEAGEATHVDKRQKGMESGPQDKEQEEIQPCNVVINTEPKEEGEMDFEKVPMLEEIGEREQNEQENERPNEDERRDMEIAQENREENETRQENGNENENENNRTEANENETESKTGTEETNESEKRTETVEEEEAEAEEEVTQEEVAQEREEETWEYIPSPNSQARANEQLNAFADRLEEFMMENNLVSVIEEMSANHEAETGEKENIEESEEEEDKEKEKADESLLTSTFFKSIMEPSDLCRTIAEEPKALSPYKRRHPHPNFWSIAEIKCIPYIQKLPQEQVSEEVDCEDDGPIVEERSTVVLTARGRRLVKRKGEEDFWVKGVKDLVEQLLASITSRQCRLQRVQNADDSLSMWVGCLRVAMVHWMNQAKDAQLPYDFKVEFDWEGTEQTKGDVFFVALKTTDEDLDTSAPRDLEMTAKQFHFAYECRERFILVDLRRATGEAYYLRDPFGLWEKNALPIAPQFVIDPNCN